MCIYIYMYPSRASTRIWTARDTWIVDVVHIYLYMYMCVSFSPLSLSLSLSLPPCLSLSTWQTGLTDWNHLSYLRLRLPKKCKLRVPCTEVIRWQRLIGCRIFIGHFPQKSPIIIGSFAKNELQLKASYGSVLNVSVSLFWTWVSVCTKSGVPSGSASPVFWVVGCIYERGGFKGGSVKVGSVVFREEKFNFWLYVFKNVDVLSPSSVRCIHTRHLFSMLWQKSVRCDMTKASTAHSSERYGAHDKICRRVSSEKRPRTRICHGWERLV